MVLLYASDIILSITLAEPLTSKLIAAFSVALTYALITALCILQSLVPLKLRI